MDKDKAFARIFRRRTIVVVERWLARLGVPRRDRSDLAQDVLLAAYVSFHTYDPKRARPERWLNQIAVHIAARYRELARHWREERWVDGFDAELDVPSAEEQLACEQDRQFMLDVLQSLDVDERLVVMEHDLEERSMLEIAARRGLPLSTAYKWRARGLAAFQEAAGRRLRAESVALSARVDGSTATESGRC
jgi:RNA polymerase sigma-70 factor, ECF subfamily